ESVSHLGNMVFSYCDNLVGASVQANIESVPEWAFYGCTDLAEVVLGEKITSAEDKAFYGCDSFSSLYYPSGNENTLVESIKSTSIETFDDQNLRGDTPTNDEFDGAETVYDGNLITQTDTTLKQSADSTIATHTTNTIRFDETGFTKLSSSLRIEALIDKDAGWDELLLKIQRAIESGLSNDGSIYVLVRLQTGKSVPSKVLNELRGKKVQLDIHLENGSYFGIDCERISLSGVGDSSPMLDCTVTKDPSLSEKHEDVLEGADTYKVSYDDKIDVDFSTSIFVGKENAHSVATIYFEKSNGRLERIQSAIVDKNGYATFYLKSITQNTDIVLGLNVEGERPEDAIIPDSTAVDNYGLLERYKPIEYAEAEERRFLGLNSWQFALMVFGVISGIIIVTSIIAVLIYRKKRLQLIRELKKKAYIK
ncbi:MAG: leucine-rich repeat protein, partial [Clostridia bacterium]|nr:leucine-rich repeat protein [Clostridia bacterium]